ncbi:BNR repeat-containing protein [Sphingobacterium sp. FBM7-1]|uniref:BNR repeat-containing protein n=1 Tax=Sphingobacterium sp. FBM7-1 TaxID=2886688 RepID=UPI001D0F7FD8|nr:BNR repeat-containing protein [Sphingobacterium sp. FBM7-1]MCC2600337.1 BNR repeat-containing protein [Sphingobacterium sp. FBM7-1]
MKRILLLPLLLLSSFVFPLFAQISSGYEVSPEGAWCWFADPRAIHHENSKKKIRKTYIGYIDVHGNIKAMQYDFVKNEQVEVLVRSWFQPDDHNNPTFLVLPDDRVMIFYSRHTDEACFYYRISQKPGDITTLGEEKRLETDHNTTYPSPFILADDPDHIYLCWRGLKWHPTIAKLSLPGERDEVRFVDKPYQIVQSTGSRPYAKYMSNGKDKIYMVYTTGHPDNENPNFLYFNYVDVNTMTLHDVGGRELSAIEEGVFRVNTTKEYVQRFPATVVDNPQLRDWVWQVAMDKDGAPVIAFVRISEDKKSHDYYYGKWTGATWQKTFLANGGGHFHQTENLEMCYSGGMAIDPDNVNQVYCSVPVEGKHGRVYEIIKYTLDDAGQVVSTDTITHNSVKNNVRPYMIQGSNRTPLRLMWMHGDYYDWIVSKSRPGYPTAIHADFSGFKEDKQPRRRLLSEGTQFSGKLPNKFTIHTKIQLDTANYKGTVLKIGELIYAVNAETLQPELSYVGKKYISGNKLATADSWLRADRGTNGRWYALEKLIYLELTLVYDRGTCSIYINGLLDQHVAIGKLDRAGVVISSPNHDLHEIAVYENVLNWQEITALR